jgi:hypothetical protein
MPKRNSTTAAMPPEEPVSCVASLDWNEPALCAYACEPPDLVEAIIFHAFRAPPQLYLPTLQERTVRRNSTATAPLSDDHVTINSPADHRLDAWSLVI